MNDPNTREIPDDTGYSLAFILSIGIHGVLACAFWIGAGIHSAKENAPATVTTSSAQLHSIATPTLTSSSRPPRLAGQTPVRPGLDDLKTTLSFPTGTDKRAANPLPEATKTAALEKSADVRNQKSHAKSAVPPKPKPPRMSAKKLADTSGNTPRLKKNASGKAENKTRLASVNASKKGRNNPNTKKAIASQNTNTRDVAEIRKLESMREAELRRINKNLS
jgi:hypothetical protein